MAMPPSARRRGLLAGVSCAALVMTAPALSETRPSLNLYGATGLIDMPSGEAQPDGIFNTSITSFAGITRTTLTFQITPRLSASFRYQGIGDWNKSIPEGGPRRRQQVRHLLRPQLRSPLQGLRRGALHARRHHRPAGFRGHGHPERRICGRHQTSHPAPEGHRGRGMGPSWQLRQLRRRGHPPRVRSAGERGRRGQCGPVVPRRYGGLCRHRVAADRPADPQGRIFLGRLRGRGRGPADLRPEEPVQLRRGI